MARLVIAGDQEWTRDIPTEADVALLSIVTRRLENEQALADRIGIRSTAKRFARPKRIDSDDIARFIHDGSTRVAAHAWARHEERIGDLTTARLGVMRIPHAADADRVIVQATRISNDVARVAGRWFGGRQSQAASRVVGQVDVGLNQGNVRGAIVKHIAHVELHPVARRWFLDEPFRQRLQRPAFHRHNTVRGRDEVSVSELVG